MAEETQKLNSKASTRIKSGLPLITEIQRFSLQDGPGIRTTIFVKGCPLRCPWCHNPESQITAPEFYFYSDRCVGCGQCAQVCSVAASTMAVRPGRPPKLSFDRKRCLSCFKCLPSCLTKARTLIGQHVDLDSLVRECLSDDLFYRNSGGGVTLSGGDPLLFPEFVREIAEKLHARGIHLALETSLFPKWPIIEPLIPLIDLFLVDIKTMNPAKHLETIGWPAQVILENLENLIAAQAQVRIHLPIIPGFNDSREDYQAYLDYLARFASRLVGVDVLPYHCFGESKYAFLGREYRFKGTQDLKPAAVLPFARDLKATGLVSVTVGGLAGMGNHPPTKSDASVHREKEVIP